MKVRGKLPLLLSCLAVLLLLFSTLGTAVLAVTTGWATSNNDVYFTDGNVGIGTNAPANLLDVKYSAYTGGYPESPLYKSKIVDTTWQSTWDNLNSPINIEVVGDTLYIMTGGGVFFADVSDPTSPQYISEINSSTQGFSMIWDARDFVVVGDYLYLINHGNNCLMIVDISDPAVPILVSDTYNTDTGFSTMQGLYSIFVEGNYAYIGNDYGWLLVIDVTNKSAPVFVDTYIDGVLFTRINQPVDFIAIDDYLLVAASVDKAITVMDNSDPTDLTLVTEMYEGDGTFHMLDQVNSMSLNGDYLYVTSTPHSAFTVIDVSDPANPELVSETADGTGDFDKMRHLVNVSSFGNYIAVASMGEESITLVDVSDPSTPQVAYEITDGTTGDYDKLLDPHRVRVVDGIMYIMSYSESAVTLVEVNSDIASYPTLSATNTGKVGIGTSTPFTTLDINGEIKLKINNASPFTCDNDRNGALSLTSGYRTCVCKSGTGWVFTSDGSTACTW